MVSENLCKHIWREPKYQVINSDFNHLYVREEDLYSSCQWSTEPFAQLVITMWNFKVISDIVVCLLQVGTKFHRLWFHIQLYLSTWSYTMNAMSNCRSLESAKCFTLFTPFSRSVVCWWHGIFNFHLLLKRVFLKDNFAGSVWSPWKSSPAGKSTTYSDRSCQQSENEK